MDKTYRIYIYKGRSTGGYTIYIPLNTLMINKFVSQVSLKTFQRGVGYTMAEVKERFWILKVKSAHKTRNSQVLWI